MRRYLVTMAGAAVLFAGALAWAGQGNPGNTNPADESLEAWVAAFNAHDTRAVAAAYAEDADLVVHTGERQKGRAAIEKGLAEFFAKNPKVKTKLKVNSRRYIKPDVVVEDGQWEETGHAQEGIPTKGHFTSVLVKQGGAWLTACDRVFVPVEGTAPRAEAAADRTGLRDVLLEREKQSWEMTKRRDIAGLRDFYADDFVDILGDGTRLGKAELLKALPDFKIQSYSIGEKVDLVTVSLDVATLVFTVAVTSSFGDGKPGTSTMSATSTYVRRDGQWRNVLYQETPVASAKK